MQQIKVSANEADQRLDKLLHKILSGAPGSVIYKQLRSKNITLNGKKAAGGEKTKEGDVLSFFFSEQTFAKFAPAYAEILLRECGENEAEQCVIRAEEYKKAYQILGGIKILYEDTNVLILHKPAGILTQKAEPTDLSLNEWMVGYLLEEGKLSEKQLVTFKPSVCNRLDRNTSGMVICGVSLKGSQKMSELLKNRDLHKYYRLLVKGQMTDKGVIEGYLIKDKKNNRVSVLSSQAYERLTESEQKLYSAVHTRYQPVISGEGLSLVEAELVTGKTHQLRAHFASIGFPLLGDEKYGDPKWNAGYRDKYGIQGQLLHAYRLEFPELQEPFLELSHRVLVDKLPKIYDQLIKDGE